MKYTRKTAFTMVELIIVIAIIAFLAVSSTLVLTKFVWNSRDSRRVADINQIKKWLEIYYMDNNKYPMPESDLNFATWTALWAEISYKWVLWNSLSSDLYLKKWPSDPSNSQQYYTYWVTADKRQYQISTVLENGYRFSYWWNWGETWSIKYLTIASVPQVYAAWEKAKIDWNYKWTIIFATWWQYYLLNAPSLIYANNWIVDMVSNNTYYVADNNDNLPYWLWTSDLSVAQKKWWNQVLKDLTSNSSAILTAVNITSYYNWTSKLTDLISWTVLDSFWWTLMLNNWISTIWSTQVFSASTWSSWSTFWVFTWATKASATYWRNFPVSASVNWKYYLMWGQNGWWASLNYVEEYNPTTNTWTTKATMPTSTTYTVAGVINNKIYVAWWYDGWSYLNAMQEYDPSTNTWATKQFMPWSRSYTAWWVVNNKFYVIWWSNPTMLSTVQEYDPTSNTWASKQSMPTARNCVWAWVYNNKIYVVWWNNWSVLNYLEIYDPATNTWSTWAAMPTARRCVWVDVINSKMYVFGWYDAVNTALTTVEEYDFTNNTWTSRTAMPGGKAWAAVSVLNNKIYVAGLTWTTALHEFSP